MSDNEKATKPEDLTRLFVERANDGDAAGIAALYEEQAVMAYPPGQTVGRDAIRALWEKVLANAPGFEPESPLPTLVSGDIALTSTPPKDGAGARAQVARRQPDGTWLRLLDQPEFRHPRLPHKLTKGAPTRPPVCRHRIVDPCTGGGWTHFLTASTAAASRRGWPMSTQDRPFQYASWRTQERE